MANQHWTEKFDAYFDGELAPDEARAVDEHLRGCASCAAEGLRRVLQKRAVQDAGQKFAAEPAFRARIQKNIGGNKSSARKWGWRPVFAIAAALIVALAIFSNINRSQNEEQRLVSELVDQHVATLASSNPVDVVSTDRHTVKPWFAGKIPFTFNLPELQDSPFVLVGGRVSYLSQSPGAELIFRVRQHQISAFIFQDRGGVSENDAGRPTLSFQVRSWHQNGLRYFVIGDASPQDLDKLSGLLKAAS